MEEDLGSLENNEKKKAYVLFDKMGRKENFRVMPKNNVEMDSN